MSRTKHGFDCRKGPRGSDRQIKKIAQGKIRMREKALCKKAMDGLEVSPIDFPKKIECLDKWGLW